MEEPLVIRKRVIGEAELDEIRGQISSHWHRGRTYISKELCRVWCWRQENGALKDQVCRLLLRQLEDKGLIELPPRLRKGVLSRNRQYYTPSSQVPLFAREPFEGRLSDLTKITLRLARRNHDEKVWNYLVHQYHYKGFRILVGAHIKVIAYAGEIPVACLAWSSSVFRIKSRDAYIGWSAEQRDESIRHVANNCRFLIVPWVRVKHLASHILGLSARWVSGQWESVYGYPLYLLETFVERARFKGTCYRAANWVCVGKTRGHAKKNGTFYHHGNIKDVYVYPLRPDFREVLCQGGGAS
jgi:hypothetical protein